MPTKVVGVAGMVLICTALITHYSYMSNITSQWANYVTTYTSTKDVRAMESIKHKNRIKNTSDVYQFHWIPYLKEIYQATKLDRIYKHKTECLYAHNREYKHNFTKPLLSCDTNLPTYTEDQKKSMTRQQIDIWCEGSASFRLGITIICFFLNRIYVILVGAL